MPAKSQKGKGPAKPAKEASGKRKKSRHIKFDSYIFRVLRQVHQDIGISAKSMRIMDNFMHDVFHRLSEEAGRLAKINKTKTLTSREVQTACRLMLPGELSKHGCSEGTKAVAKFQSST